ncbi:hypothetical protein GCG54_00014535 [Colletotrichum gloeosporioides]|uniref:FAD-binding PCMH-type domain-containing protein n=1 Tax=Colletotrichum gloeosporioides TaxID=474922 RepID=A0A8H4CX67_COLGL|nr:uncharacterized protein GCG54_00014535 [Colletotrichum gloeosporioides]KAF3811783.1 hypothetical protein GCG54_00014535 [Colletotrichum gloeosporioides]
MHPTLLLVYLSGAATATSILSSGNNSINYFESLPSLSIGADCACNKLSAQFGNLLLGSNSTGYTTQAEDFYDIRAVLEPRCIFMPTDADQIASGVSILASCGAQFAIRAGGHMNSPGSNDIDGGVLLALNSLTDIEISPDNSTVSVSPGNRWVDVYEALAPYRLYSIGGRMKTIGVSGLSLIGGFHYLTNKYGFAMDNVFGHKTMKADADQLYRIYEVWKAAVEDISDVEGLIPTLVLNTMAPSAMSVAKNNGIGNVWGLDDDEALISESGKKLLDRTSLISCDAVWQTSTAWDKEESDLRVTNFARGVLDDMHAENQAKGLASESYTWNPFLGFPARNVDRMRTVRAAYDPLDVFTRQNWGGFKLPRP